MEPAIQKPINPTTSLTANTEQNKQKRMFSIIFIILCLIISALASPFIGFVIAWGLMLIGVFGPPEQLEMAVIGVMLAGFLGGTILGPFLFSVIFRKLAKKLGLSLPRPIIFTGLLLLAGFGWIIIRVATQSGRYEDYIQNIDKQYQEDAKLPQKTN